jgi:hypothetical protein
MGLWFLFYDSCFGLRYIDILGYLASTAPDFRNADLQDLVGIAFRFSTSAQPHGVLAGSVFLAMFHPDSLSVGPPYAEALAQTNSPLIPSVVLRAAQVFPSIELAQSLAALAVGGSPAAWAALLRYARLSADHAFTLLSADAWLSVGGDSCVRTALAVFVHTHLRDPLARRPEFPGFLISLAASRRPDMLRHVCSLLQRVHIDKDLLVRIDAAGFFSTYFGITLTSPDTATAKFGIIVADLCGRVAFIPQWINTLNLIIGLFETRYDDLGDDLICVLSTFSVHRETMAIMKAKGLVEYYQSLLPYEGYRQYASFFINNAARL